ncbi:hypothetical protein EMN47_11475 [Prolixibacteraceae bacterium JC049]|nr:hypothetical protein [Prolixibacteraceae bacterium JC049]
MRTLALLIIFVSIACLSKGQKFIDLYGDYLGQTPPGEIPEVFAKGIISTERLEHSAAIFSNDGNEVYWKSEKLWFMKRIDNRWTKPAIFAPMGDSLHYGSPFLTSEGDQIYFIAEGKQTSKVGIPENSWIRYTNLDIWLTERKGKEWGYPKSISPVINSNFMEAQVSVTNDGTIYFLGYLDGVKGECGIFRSKLKDGKYLKPEPLPESINSKSQDWTPFIAPDESYLIWSSYRSGQYGAGDLYISFHNLKDDTWSEAINMGATINTWSQERLPAVSPDGKYLFFTRWTQENNHDVYWVSSKIIEKLRKEYNAKK